MDHALKHHGKASRISNPISFELVSYVLEQNSSHIPPKSKKNLCEMVLGEDSYLVEGLLNPDRKTFTCLDGVLHGNTHEACLRVPLLLHLIYTSLL